MSKTSENLARDLEPIRCRTKSFGEYDRSGYHADLSVEPVELLQAVGFLFEKGYFLEDISGVDVTEGILLVYHFDRYDESGRVVLRLTVPHEAKKAPSISSIFSGADWHERECFDFFGVEFENHPGLKPLLLPDDMKLRPLLKVEGRKSISALQYSPGEEGKAAAPKGLRIDPEKCKGCGLCKKKCPVQAIEGEKKKPHTINQELCIQCMECLNNCKFKSIEAL